MVLSAKYWVVLVGLLILTSLVGRVAAQELATFGDFLSLPFAVGETWYICQGYNGQISHQNVYALDLSVDPASPGPTGCNPSTADASTGRGVLAPADGTVVPLPTDDLVRIDFDAGGSSVIGHLEPSSRASGDVKRGDLIGTVAGPNPLNGEYTHIHTQIRLSGTGPTVPFDDAHGTRFLGAPNLPDIGGTNQHSRVALTSQAVKILSADVTIDRIQVLLGPSSATGTLELELVGATGNHIIRTATRTGGIHIETFDIPNLAAGEYTQVRATWTVSGASSTDNFDHHIQVLSDYRHSQYNTPHENQGTGAPIPAYITAITGSACNFTATTLRSDFLDAVNLNGSGVSTSHGSIVREFFCINQPGAPGDASGRSFRAVSQITGRCGALGSSGELNTRTVAVNQSHPHLGCGDQVFIHTQGVKTITDFCPACVERRNCSLGHAE